MLLNKFLSKIISEMTSCIFISPHPDDAVLSCATLLTELAGKIDITVINVFTSAHKGPYTLSARKYLMNANGYSDATVLSNDRLREDEEILSKLNVTVINLGLLDALFRKKRQDSFLGRIIPEVNHIYPTYRWHVIKAISPKDPALDDLKKILEKFNKKDAVIFAPCGIGNHVDHLITRRVCENLFDNLILYSDFPYNSQSGKYGDPEKGYQSVELKTDLGEKSKLIKSYKTQFPGLFPDGEVPYHKEVYFMSEKL